MPLRNPLQLGNGRSFPSTPFNIPTPTRGGGPQAQLNLGDLGEDIARGAVDIGLEWVRNRLIPSSGNVVPTGSNPLVPSGPAVPSQGCPAGQVGYPPLCFDVQPGGATQGGGMMVTPGEAVMGRYGAALQPQVTARTVARCLPGMVLGNDGLCYNRRDLNRRDRKWIPGRKPLLTGGDLNAISRANRAANKLKTQQKRLQKMGMLPKPNRGRARGGPPAGLRQLPAGTSIVNVE